MLICRWRVLPLCSYISIDCVQAFRNCENTKMELPEPWKNQFTCNLYNTANRCNQNREMIRIHGLQILQKKTSSFIIFLNLKILINLRRVGDQHHSVFTWDPKKLLTIEQTQKFFHQTVSVYKIATWATHQPIS